MSQPRQRGPPGSHNSQLFEDTSQSPQPMYGGANMAAPQGGFMQPGANFPGANLMNEQMANMAMQYGHTLAGQGKEMLEKNVSN